MPFEHRDEWEWGWKTPLLLRFQAVPAVTDFLSFPIERLALAEAEAVFARRLSELRTSRIGIRFERIQEALFRAHPATESLETGLVIPGRTEIDLLHRIRGLPGTVVHWEVAVKFYLGLDDGGSIDADRYIGPSLKDTLGIKTRAIFGRQLTALSNPETRAAFGPRFGIAPAETILPYPKVHGILFNPFRGRADRRTPPLIAEDGMRGAWFEFDRLADFLGDVAAEFAGSESLRIRWLSDRRDWIRDQVRRPGGAEDESGLKDCLKSALAARWQSHFAGDGEPIQGTVLLRNERRDSELRFFIVPNGWHRAAERGLETLRGEGRIKT